MAQAAQFQHGLRVLEALHFVLTHEVGEHGGELLQRERVLAGRPGQFGDQDFGVLRHVHASLFRDPMGGLAHHVGVQTLLFRREDVVGDLRGFGLGQETAAVVLHDGLELFADRPVHDDRLL